MKRQLAIILGFALLIAGCSTSQRDIEQWVKGEDEAWNSHDVDKVLSFYSDDCVYEDLAAQKINHGTDEIRTFLVNAFKGFPDSKIETKSFFVSGDHVCAEFVWSGTYLADIPGLPPATGKSLSIRGVHIIELRGNKAISITDYYDGASMMRQLGFLPTTSDQSSEKEGNS